MLVRGAARGDDSTKKLDGTDLLTNWVLASLLRATALQVLVLRDEESPLSVAIRENVREKKGPLRRTAAARGGGDFTKLGLRRVLSAYMCPGRPRSPEEEKHPRRKIRRSSHHHKMLRFMIDDACRRALKVAFHGLVDGRCSTSGAQMCAQPTRAPGARPAPPTQARRRPSPRGASRGSREQLDVKRVSRAVLWS